MRNAVNLADNEVLDTFHPAVGMVQMLAEVVDPINYARYWYSDDVYWSNVPANILMTEGMSDAYTPPESIEILAATAGIPVVGNAVSINDAHKIKALGNPDTVQGNRNTYDDHSSQVDWSNTLKTVFAIFYNEDAGRTYGRVLESHPVITP